MTVATAETFASLVLLALAVSAVAGLIGLVAILLLRRTSTVFLRATLRLAQRGLAPGAQSYLQEWILSWEADLRQESEEAGVGQLRQEIMLLARFVSLPWYIRCLREHAASADVREQPEASSHESDTMYGRFLKEDGGRMDYEVDPARGRLRLRFSDGYSYEVQSVTVGPTTDCFALLLKVRNVEFEAKPATRGKYIESLAQRGELLLVNYGWRQPHRHQVT